MRPLAKEIHMISPTPLLDALRQRDARDSARFHTPGHAGRAVIEGWEKLCALDFTELSDTGNLYTDRADGPIRAAERLFAKAYSAEDCLFLTGGATQGILSLLSAFAKPGDTVALDRNCHYSVHNALALLDLHPVWVQAPLLEPFHITTDLPPVAMDSALTAHPEAVCALITSPTYYGVLSDLSGLSRVCRAHGVPLLVDAAHGAHLPFLDGFDAPISSGVAAAVLSAHKTLPALGQAAFLLTGDSCSVALLRHRAALFGSSSPSYLLMASMDAARAYMETEGQASLRETSDFANKIRQSTQNYLGYLPRPLHSSFLTPPSSFTIDPLRLCLYVGNGFAVAARLEREFGVVCEMADARNVVFLLSALTTRDECDRLEAALRKILVDLPAALSPTTSPPVALPVMCGKPRQALFDRRDTRLWSDCLGLIAAEPVNLYPPGAPLVARGERIGEEELSILAEADFEGTIQVLKG